MPAVAIENLADSLAVEAAIVAAEIDQALKRADAVVVLWSTKSIESAWVRDEAATGRDSGKLVPALIDPVHPPLGFRQYQTTDLTSWKRRRNWPRFQELLEAIGALSMERLRIAYLLRQSQPGGPSYVCLYLRLLRLLCWSPRVFLPGI